ncbi:MAG: thermonuclease family protein [Kangiellaceae bacterium]|jgi:micrococcal nuclease|nr:thermonuclease family protein [Kangiellaceae bacterium]
MYEYKAFVTKVYDGDSITADIDLGFNMAHTNTKIRLIGINAPELRKADPDSYAARDYLADLILNKTITIQTVEKDKYGRWLADIYIGGKHINRLMLLEGYAVQYKP